MPLPALCDYMAICPGADVKSLQPHRALSVGVGAAAFWEVHERIAGCLRVCRGALGSEQGQTPTVMWHWLGFRRVHPPK